MLNAEIFAMPLPKKSSAGAWTAFLVGALIVVVAVVGYAVYSTNHSRRMDVAVNMPSLHQVPIPTPTPDPTPLPVPLRKP